MTLPLAVVAGFGPLAASAIEGYQYNGASGVVKRLTLGLTGYNTEDRRWYPGEMSKVLLPVVLGAFAHKLAGAFGINRALGRARIPFLRI